MERIHLYCDGSFGPAVMLSAQESVLGPAQVGRILVLIPALDYALLERSEEKTSSAIEAAAIRCAVDYCERSGLDDFYIWSDALGEVNVCGDARVRWRSRSTNPAGWLLERLVSRAGYLRQTQSVVRKRRPTNDVQREIFNLLTTPRNEIVLSRSLLWDEIRRKASG